MYRECAGDQPLSRLKTTAPANSRYNTYVFPPTIRTSGLGSLTKSGAADEDAHLARSHLEVLPYAGGLTALAGYEQGSTTADIEPFDWGMRQSAPNA